MAQLSATHAPILPELSDSYYDVQKREGKQFRGAIATDLSRISLMKSRMI
jgi:hypothetical protein